MSTRGFYPDVFPGTRIDFSNRSVVPSPVEFDRATSATYVDKDGLVKTAYPSEPRFSYDPETGESLGLLVEGSGTNLQFPSIPIISSTAAVITPNAAISPDGTITATLVEPTGANASGVRSNSIVVKSATYYAHSFFYKPNGYNVAGIDYGSGIPDSYAEAYIDVVSGNSFFQAPFISISREKIDNGWYRILAVQLIISPGTAPFWGKILCPRPSVPTATNQSFTHIPGSGGYFWGHQEEQVSFPTSYIPTTSAPATRGADTFSVPIENFKSARVIFSSPSSNYNSISSPALTFSDSQNTSVPYTLELSGPRFVPTLVTKYNFIGQSYLSIPDYPTLASPPSASSVAFNYDSSTGAMKLATSAGDDATTSVVSLDEKYNIPAPAGYSLDTLVVGGSASIKEIYLWNKSLGADQLASVAKDLGAIGRPEFESTGLQDDVLYDIADARPTLDLNFAERKNLSNSVNGFQLVTFERTSAGTYVDEDRVVRSAAADEPRFDHDPVTGDSLGLLVEEERTNYVLYSQNPSNWSVTAVGDETIPTITPNFLDPSGYMTACRFQGNRIGVGEFLRLVFPTSATLPNPHDVIYSVWLKSNTGANQTIKLFIPVVAGNVVVTPEWKRFDVPVRTASSTSEYIALQIDNSNTQNCDILVWAPQLEVGTFPTSYIPTPATFVSRSTSATYYDANGIIQTAGPDVARDDAYFPDADGVFRPAGLLLEGSGTNLVTNSEDFSVWSSANITVTADNIAAPDGATTADLFTTSSNGICYRKRGVTLAAGGTHCISVFAKAGTTDWIWLEATAYDTVQRAFFQLTGSGILGALSPGSTSYIQALPNGWYRCSFTFSTTTDLSGDLTVGLAASDGERSVTSGTTAYFWGAQLEASPYPTSYIPTDATPGGVVRAADSSSSSTVIRKPDVASITGTNFNSFYNQNEGTFFADATMSFALSQTNKFPDIYTSGSFPNRLWSLYLNNGVNRLTIGVDAHSAVLGTFSSSPQSFKVAQALSNTSLTYSASKDGGSTITGSLSKAITNTSFISIGGSEGAVKHISRLTYWPARLPDTTLQTLTSTAIETWDLVFDSSLSSNGTCAIITTGTTTYTVDWGDGSPVQTITATGTFTAEHTYVVPKEYNVKVGVVSGAFRPYYNGSSVYARQLVKIRRTPDGWVNTSTSGFGTNLDRGWFGANNLKKIDRQTNTTGVTSFSLSWRDCKSLTSFPLIDTSSGTNFQQAWQSCSSLTSFPLIDTSSGTNFFATWYGCSSLTSFPLIDTSADTPAGTNFQQAWQFCSSLTSFPLIDTSSGINFFQTWHTCSSLTSFPLLNTSNGTNFFGAWYNCSSLTSFPLIDTSSGTSFYQAWQLCSSLTSFPLIDTAASTTFYFAWRDCTNLTDFPANFFNSWTGTPANNCFVATWLGCTSLTSTSVENIYNSLSISPSSSTPPASGTNITVDYNASTGTPDITISAIDLTAKGWTPTLNNVAQTNPYSFASLDLDFATNKTLDDNVSGTNLITFSRGSIGTYVDGSGVIQTASNDQPRFDHDPVTNESLGLLVEELRTNLIIDSEEFAAPISTWIRSNTSVTSNTTIAPDGTLTADTVSNTPSQPSLIRPSLSLNTSLTYTITLYVKPLTTNKIISFEWQGANTFDLSNPGPGVQTLPNGWYRLTVTKTGVNAGPAIYIGAYGTTSDSVSFAFWGAQCEEGSFATSYIPTAGAPGGVTRVADEASITGTNFSSWYEQSEGTVYCQGTSNSTSNSTYWSLQGSGLNGITTLVYPSNQITYQVSDTGFQANLNFAAYPSVDTIKTAASYKVNDFAAVKNGETVSVDGSGILPTITSFVIGNYLGGGGSFDYTGTISRITYWPRRLTNTSLQYLTQ